MLEFDMRHRFGGCSQSLVEEERKTSNNLDLATAMDMAELDLQLTNKRLRVLVLYGSLRRIDPVFSCIVAKNEWPILLADISAIFTWT
jgi:hypothetical protein